MSAIDAHPPAAGSADRPRCCAWPANVVVMVARACVGLIETLINSSAWTRWPAFMALVFRS
jgi:hypothetical protein